MSSLIDCHCHLDFKAFDADRKQVLQRAFEQGIKKIIIPATEEKYWSRIHKLCQKYPNLSAAYGLHPYWSNFHQKEQLAHLSCILKKNNAIAVGECGLDFRAEQADKKTQQFFFEAQLAIAKEQQLPVIIHAVKATEAVICTLKKVKPISGMIHSYSGSLNQAQQLIELGFYISFSASVTHPKAIKIKSIAKQLPLKYLLVESDAPDQIGFSQKTKRNEPAFLIDTVAEIATLRGISKAEVCQQTSLNTKKLFSL